jgi:diacylglycerol kinase family enzyme
MPLRVQYNATGLPLQRETVPAGPVRAGGAEGTEAMPAEQCVIYNPTAGYGRAQRHLDSLRRALGPGAEFLPTQDAGHAEELALVAAGAGVPLVGAAGGDGTIHEVANGLLRAERADTALAVYPIGSANDYAHSLGLTEGWWERSDRSVALRPVDVGLVCGANGRQRYFINALGIGFTGAVNLESRRVGRLRGLTRYLAGLLRALRYHYHFPVMTITLNGEVRTQPTLSLSLGIGQREGNFLLAPRAVLDDGFFDYLHAGRLTRWQLLSLVPAGIRGRLPDDHPGYRMGRCREVKLSSEAPLTVHGDGEFFCSPEDDVRALEVGILSGRLRVQARS